MDGWVSSADLIEISSTYFNCDGDTIVSHRRLLVALTLRDASVNITHVWLPALLPARTFCTAHASSTMKKKYVMTVYIEMHLWFPHITFWLFTCRQLPVICRALGPRFSNSAARIRYNIKVDNCSQPSLLVRIAGSKVANRPDPASTSKTHFKI